jgi:short-subunit dehydrogenase
MKLKNISEQTIIITGATSGIGLTTARMAAEKGAKLVLIARNEQALRELADELSANGTRVIYSVGDIADETTSRRAAEMAKANFGGFDTWVNNAGGSVYGRIMDVPTEDLRRLFETNFWGVVNGSKIAVEHLRERGGTLINVGSELSDATVPLQGTYAASKHAVKAFSEALRMELEADKILVSVTVIKPTAIHTPFPENAKNYLPYEPTLPSPVYAPELVAEAILHCAENPTTEFYVGEMAKINSSMAALMPRIGEKMNEMKIDSAQNSGEPAKTNRADGLYGTNSNLRERGAEDRFVLEESIYQRAKIHPLITGALAVGAGLGIAALISNSRKSKENGGHISLETENKNRKLNSFDIRDKMEVLGADGVHVGTVDRVEYGEIKLTRKDSPDGKHHLIPTEMVESVVGNKVMLTQTAEQTRQLWKTSDEPKQKSGDTPTNELTSKSARGGSSM